jgi:iron complex outermembrane receptor protein
MIGRRLRATSSLLALGLGLAAPVAAFAQDAPAAQSVSDDAGVQDIVVTAQRREERLQDTPVSVTALSAAALESRSIANLSDMSNFAPNLELHPTNRPAGGGSAFAGYIRGVGTGDFQFPTDPGIGLYVDDVYIARSMGGLLSLADISRVEVLKGPQGTLYGRNTIGGAINVVTTSPITSGDATGMVRLRTGSFGRLDGTATINAPLIQDTLGAKLSVSYLTNRGYGERYLSNERYSSENRFIVRGGIKWNVAPGVELKINGDYTRQRQMPTGGIMMAFVPSGPTVAKIARFNQYAAPYLNASLGLPVGSIVDGRWISTNPYRNYALGNQQDDADIGGVSAVLSVEITPDITLKSITAWRTIDALVEVDGDQTPYNLQQSRTSMRDNQYSQELQLAGTAFGGRLNFLLGAYAFREKGDSTLLTRSFEGIYEALIAAGLPVTPADTSNTFTTFGMTAESYALFTQETLKLTDTLSFTAGGRLNHDRKFYSTSVTRTQNNTVAVPLSSAVADWTSFTPKLGIDWKPTRDMLLYASWSQGFKSGGFGASTVASTPTPRYDPEKLTSYEIGAKTAWLDNRLIVNAAAFYSEYRDIQLTVQGVDPVTNANLRTTRNAGGSNIKGFELEVIAVPTRGLNFNLGAGYVDAKFDMLTASAISSGFALGSRVPQIPDWSINSGLEYNFQAAGKWSVRGDLTYKGQQLLTPADATSLQKQYALLGARLSYRPEALRGIELSVEGTNLTNNVHAYYKSTLAPTGQYVMVPDAPRQIYGSVRFSF